MNKILITESRLTVVLKNIVSQFIKSTDKEISFYTKSFGQLYATWEISLQDINHIGKNDYGKNLFECDILVETLRVEHPQDPDYIVDAHPSYLNEKFILSFQQMMNDYLKNFIPNVYVKVNFISPDSIS